jgi:hypothetical protein
MEVEVWRLEVSDARRLKVLEDENRKLKKPLAELLAAQAAISLENIRLYSDLQEREAKVRRLVEAGATGDDCVHLRTDWLDPCTGL